MFCPTCGKDNSLQLRFCASCGTNLETVSQALSGREQDFFTKTDTGMDEFIARYSEHVFKSAPSLARQHKVSGSWLLLGQGIITSLVDLFLFMLMWNFLPLRFLILLISTPFRLLAERGEHNKQEEPFAEPYKAPELTEPAHQPSLSDPIPSVTENTTVNLRRRAATKSEPASITDQLE